MWTYLVYTLSKYLDKYPEKTEKLEFNEFSDFIFDKLGRERKLLFWDGNNDILSDLIYAEQQGLVGLYSVDGVTEKTDGWGGTVLELPTDSKTFFGNVKISVMDMKKIRSVEEIVEKSSSRFDQKLFSEYNNRIKQAIDSMPSTSQKPEYRKTEL